MISECKNMYIEKVDRKCYRTERRMELYYIKCSMGSFDKRKGGGFATTPSRGTISQYLHA